MLEKKEIQIPNAEFFPHIIQLINEGHTVTISLRGYSMRPFLEDKRDSAILAKCECPRVGDPILAEIRPGEYVLHRVISIDGDKITLRGDGNIGVEECQRADVRAIATGFYRKGRKNLDPITGMKWRCYSWLWTRLFPVRHYLLAIYRRIPYRLRYRFL